MPPVSEYLRFLAFYDSNIFAFDCGDESEFLNHALMLPISPSAHAYSCCVENFSGSGLGGHRRPVDAIIGKANTCPGFCLS